MSSTAPVKVSIPLRVLQSLLSTIVLALCIYVSSAKSPLRFTETPFLLFTSTLSIFTSFHLVLSPHIFPCVTNLLPTFFLLTLNSLLYLIGFITLAIHLAKQTSCNRAPCIVTNLITVFAAVSYVAWATEAVIVGMEISKRKEHENEDDRERIVKKANLDEKFEDGGRSERFDEVQLGWA